jgi:hypothetical protein
MPLTNHDPGNHLIFGILWVDRINLLPYSMHLSGLLTLICLGVLNVTRGHTFQEPDHELVLSSIPQDSAFRTLTSPFHPVIILPIDPIFADTSRVLEYASSLTRDGVTPRLGHTPVT